MTALRSIPAVAVALLLVLLIGAWAVLAVLLLAGATAGASVVGAVVGAVVQRLRSSAAPTGTPRPAPTAS